MNGVICKASLWFSLGSVFIDSLLLKILSTEGALVLKSADQYNIMLYHARLLLSFFYT